MWRHLWFFILWINLSKELKKLTWLNLWMNPCITKFLKFFSFLAVKISPHCTLSYSISRTNWCRLMHFTFSNWSSGYRLVHSANLHYVAHIQHLFHALHLLALWNSEIWRKAKKIISKPWYDLHCSIADEILMLGA
jgi:hypothetical protein